MAAPQDLSVAEIRNYMLENGCKVTNHALVKHFKKFLTQSETQTEARKQFKTYVNILATIKVENNQKYLILRKRYINECPAEEAVQRAVAAAGNESAPSSPGGASIASENSLLNSPMVRMTPPPYKPPPEVNSSQRAMPPISTGLAVHQENVDNFRECVNEFAAVMQRLDPERNARKAAAEAEEISKDDAVEKRAKSISRLNSIEENGNKENIPRFSFSSGASGASTGSTETAVAATDCADGKEKPDGDVGENPISVKEATRKFNRMASMEEEAKIISPPPKKKSEQLITDEIKDLPEVTLSHPRAKEWVVAMAKASYQELAKLANDAPELVKLQDPATGYTALHWAAKHGNEDVVKLIAGTYKADVNARSNGGYTPLHLAMQFKRSNIFELLCNVYKANRDLMDWSGNKPLDYGKQRTTVSASTYSSEYIDLTKGSPLELNNNYIGRGGGGTGLGTGGGTVGSALTRSKKRYPLRYATISAASGGSPLSRTQSLMSSRRPKISGPIQMDFYTKDDYLRPCDSISSPAPKQRGSSPAADVRNLNNNSLQMSSKESLSDAEQGENTMASYKGSVSVKDNYGTLSKGRRKDSFLRKTFRAAAAATSTRITQHDVNTNQTLME